MKFEAAFQTWENGGTQVSSLVLRSENEEMFELFLERSKNSFATTHKFICEAEAKQAYAEACALIIVN